jgi:glycosyltransferase involved in cell wall biosynthesis
MKSTKNKRAKELTKKPKTIGVVISTYNNPAWLEKVLWGFSFQDYKNFQIIIADDGSSEETRKMILSFKQKEGLNIKHIWQEDNGFRKNRALNKAILAAEAEYLIFTDQDCIPRRDFIKMHFRYARKGYFLSGGYFKLPLSISQGVTRKDISDQNVFNLKWLKGKKLKLNFKWTKLVRFPFFSEMMNRITTAKTTWNGCNSSGWKADFLAVNGFNEKMEYGGEDRELGERLFNYGIKSKQIRYSAICVHLDHSRPYKTAETIQKNKALRKKVRKSRQIKTEDGIQEMFDDSPFQSSTNTMKK